MKIRRIICAAALILSCAFSAAAQGAVYSAENDPSGPAFAGEAKNLKLGEEYRETVKKLEGQFDVNRFQLPQEAAVLVVVEGTIESECNVYVYERADGVWENRMKVSGYLGYNGMSNNRVVGDRTTPVGVFRMNTPFGQQPSMDGFPSNYIQVDESYVWEGRGNKLSQDPKEDGEWVGTERYRGYYDYVIDLGFNPNAIENRGSALFLHCAGNDGGYSSGCVAVERDDMIRIMKLYGTYGDGRCFSALAPAGTFDRIYDTYGTNEGLSPRGNFSLSR